jgi:WXG100 family type VII secretion target
MYDGALLVTFDEIERAQAATTQTAANVADELNDLATYLGQLFAVWSGAAAEEYQVQHGIWSRAAQDLHSTLAQIGQMLGHSHAGFTDTEQEVTALWRR